MTLIIKLFKQIFYAHRMIYPSGSDIFKSFIKSCLTLSFSFGNCYAIKLGKKFFYQSGIFRIANCQCYLCHNPYFTYKTNEGGRMVLSPSQVALVIRTGFKPVTF